MENDVAGFCLAYLFTAALHFHLCGKPLQLHSYLKMWGLLAAGGVFFVILLIITCLLHQDQAEDSMRTLELAQSFAAMSMGWCLNFGIEGSLVMAAGGIPPPSALFVIALLTTTLCILAILVLDVLADQNQADPVALRAVVTGFGLCAGLAWEKALDSAAESITEGTSFGKGHPISEKGALGHPISEKG